MTSKHCNILYYKLRKTFGAMKLKYPVQISNQEKATGRKEVVGFTFYF